MYLGTTPTLWRQELGTTPSMIFLTSASPLLINCCWCQHWCHLCAGCCAGHYDCFADKEWSWRGTTSTQNALLQGLRFWLDDMLGPWAGEHPLLVLSLQEGTSWSEPRPTSSWRLNNIVQATSRKREGWDPAVHGHFIAQNNKSLRQRGAIERFQPTGLSTKFPLLPEILKVQQIPPSCTQVLMGRFPLLITNLETYRLTWCFISSWNNLTRSNWKIPSWGATQLTWWENGTWASATRSSSLPGALDKERKKMEPVIIRF